MSMVHGLGLGSPFGHWLGAKAKVKELKTADLTHSRNWHLYLNL